MRRLLRIILWMVKGLMLLIALAALVMWPVSKGQSMDIDAQRDIITPELWRKVVYFGSCWDGWIALGKAWQDTSDAEVLLVLANDPTVGSSPWIWTRRREKSNWVDTSWPSRAGPLRWHFADSKGPGGTSARVVAAPLWLVALTAGAWPLMSIALALRRRVKRRRAAREGLCESCGYDLRATPAAGGALLAVCPECGKASPAGNKPSPPPS